MVETSRVVHVACLGKLGQFGNQLFQYAFGRLYVARLAEPGTYADDDPPPIGMEEDGVALVVPQWLGAYVFAATDEKDGGGGVVIVRADEVAAKDSALGPLPLLADRVILSHRGWRAWAMTREPLATLAKQAQEARRAGSSSSSSSNSGGGRPKKKARNGQGHQRAAAAGGEGRRGGRAAAAAAAATAPLLSNRDIRRSMPQVWGESLTSRHHRHVNCELWGWFQFHTSCYAPHRSSIRHMFRPVDALRAPLDKLVGRIRRGSRTGSGGGGSASGSGDCSSSSASCSAPLVCIHHRAGQGYTSLGGQSKDEEKVATGSAGASGSAGSRTASSSSRSSSSSSSADGGGKDWAGDVKTVEWSDDGQVLWTAPIAWAKEWLASSEWPTLAEGGSKGVDDGPSSSEGGGDGGGGGGEEALNRPLPPPASSMSQTPRLVVCTDLDSAGRDALLQELCPPGSAQHEALVDPTACAEWGEARAIWLQVVPEEWHAAFPMWVDFQIMAACDVLAVSNSTFSFFAAMLNSAEADASDAGMRPAEAAEKEGEAAEKEGEGQGKSTARCVCRRSRFFRPDPQEKKLVAFDPWDAHPLLHAATK